MHEVQSGSGHEYPLRHRACTATFTRPPASFHRRLPLDPHSVVHEHFPSNTPGIEIFFGPRVTSSDNLPLESNSEIDFWSSRQHWPSVVRLPPFQASCRPLGA